MLENYLKKRNFAQTPEPKGVLKTKNWKLKTHYSFVVQKHFASHLHYDFRLEIGGVLKSWAIPKGPSLNPQNKRLAIQTEDHPIEYKDFHGEIPTGQYGAGKVEIWDTGEFIPREDPAKQWQKGKIEFELRGKKLKGAWLLLQFKKDPKNWLWFKKKDDWADNGIEITESSPDPVNK